MPPTTRPQRARRIERRPLTLAAYGLAGTAAEFDLVPLGDEPVPVFVYGTLRHGCGNARMTRRVGPTRLGATTGTLRYAWPGFTGYPVLEPGDGVAHGEVFSTWPEDLRDAWSMEVGAGYTPRWILVQLEDGPPWATPAVAFLWERSGEGRDLGGLVPHGDWLRR